MSVTSGFYNGLSHDRKYNAVQMSSLFDGIINDGIFQSVGTYFTVTASSGFTVKVGIGKAWFNSHWIQNDAILPLTLSDPEVVLARIDAVIIEVNTTDSVRAGSIKILKGTPASSPVNPKLTNDDYVHQHALCYIYRKANETAITQSGITNMIGTDSCPFITAILETASIDSLLGQWQDQLDQFVASEESDFTAWFDNVKVQLTTDAAGNLQVQIDGITALLSKDIDALKGEIKALNTNLTKIVSASVFTIPITDWVSTTIDGMAYYTYVISLTSVNTDVPDVMIGAADTLPTSAEQDAYNCIKYAIVDASALTLKLYAKSVPTANFYIRVKGVK